MLDFYADRKARETLLLKLKEDGSVHDILKITKSLLKTVTAL